MGGANFDGPQTPTQPPSHPPSVCFFPLTSERILIHTHTHTHTHTHARVTSRLTSATSAVGGLWAGRPSVGRSVAAAACPPVHSQVLHCRGCATRSRPTRIRPVVPNLTWLPGDGKAARVLRRHRERHGGRGPRLPYRRALRAARPVPAADVGGRRTAAALAGGQRAAVGAAALREAGACLR